jgi:hypothetical protein
MSNVNRFADLGGASAMTGVTVRALRAAIDRGDFQAHRLEKRIIVHVPSMMAWIESLPRVGRTPARELQDA